MTRVDERTSDDGLPVTTASTVLAFPTDRREEPKSELRLQLDASLYARQGIPAGTSIGDFVEALLQCGRDQPLASIEYGISSWGTGRLIVDVTEQGIEIRESRT